MYLKRKFTSKWQSNQLRIQKFNVNVKFVAVLLPLCQASEVSKKFLKHVVLFVVLCMNDEKVWKVA